ncbi:MAG TPA: hypothetical protein DCX06_09100 [Opitutae bacterium]|nr:hypothetical protein [Opitutae bacterium]
MKIERGEIVIRSLTGRCPNCGEFGMFKTWFRLHKHCTHCEMQLEKEESGFYFGTTSIGYVLAILFIIIPVCILVVKGLLGMWTGISVGIIGSVILCVLLYPFMLCWVIMTYFAVCPLELPKNAQEDPT